MPIPSVRRRALVAKTAPKLNDLFVIFPDLPWPRVPKRPLAEQVRAMDRQVLAARARARRVIAARGAATQLGPEAILNRLSPAANRLALNVRGQAWRVGRLRRRIHELSEFNGSRADLRRIAASLQEDVDRLAAAFVDR